MNFEQWDIGKQISKSDEKIPNFVGEVSVGQGHISFLGGWQVTARAVYFGWVGGKGLHDMLRI